MATLTAPTVGRPAKGLSSERAQKWVLAASILTGVVYLFRRLVEPTTGASSTKSTNPVSRLIGTGTPPPFGQWVVAWAASDFMLALLALAAPEIAASLAMLMIAGVLLTNGTTIVADLTGLEGKSASSGVTPASAAQVKADANTAAGAGTVPGGANSGLVHGAGTVIP